MKIDSKKKKRGIITNIISAVVFILLAYYVYNRREMLVDMLQVNPLSIAIVFILFILMVGVIAYTNLYMMKSLDKDISFKDAFLVQFANNLLNKLLPKGGAVFRAYYLKTKYDFDYSQFLSTLGGLYVLSFAISSITGLVCFAYIYFSTGRFNLPYFIAFLAIFLGTFFVIIVSPKIPESKFRIINMIKRVLDGWNRIKKRKKDVFILLILQLISNLISTISLILVYRGIGLPMSLWQGIFLASISAITSIANITPDGLGIKEALFMLASNFLATTPEIILLGLLLFRTIAFAVSILWGGLSYILLSKQLKRIGYEKKD